MNLKRSTLAAAIVSTFALGVSSQASADVYAGSALFVKDFELTISGATVAITGYSFTANSNANLNGANDNMNADCSTIGTPCSGTPPVLESVATKGAPARGLGNFSFFDTNNGQTYSNAGAQIKEAELATATPTITNQISEVNIAANGKGDSNTNVGSQTTMAFSFTVTEGGELNLKFKADPYLYVAVNTPNLVSALANATISASFELTGTNGTLVTWTPNGKNFADSDADFVDCSGVTSCSEDADNASLNVTRSLPAGNPQSNQYSSAAGWNDFEITIKGLAAGNYTLGMGATTQARAEQATRVPEPGMLALLGIGLAGMGFGSRRRKV